MHRDFLTSISFLFFASRVAGRANNNNALQKTFCPRDRNLEDSTPSGVVTDTVHPGDGRRSELLSAFFGMEDFSNRPVCNLVGGQDWMPVVFSHEVDFDTVQAQDFEIVLSTSPEDADGGAPRIGEVHRVTLMPADDVGEHRTALLMGEFFEEDDTIPTTVRIAGHVWSKDHLVNFHNASVSVTPLLDGASMVWSEMVPPDEWELDKDCSWFPWGGGSGCPSGGTRQVLRVTWNGGVRKPPHGDELDDKERTLFNVTARDTATDTLVYVTPFALGDLGDRDNNLELCLDVDDSVVPISVYFPAGYLEDPRGELNPESVVYVTHMNM